MSDLFPGVAGGVALGFVIAIVAHHYAHARVAIALGDRTPRLHGRVSLSIKRHVDVLGTIILPIVWTLVALFGSATAFFGWGKAQQLNTPAMRKPQRDLIIVALAGPVATLVLGGIFIQAAEATSGFVAEILGGIAFVSIYLAIWEILPMPGRDGGRILARFLPPSGQLKMQELAQYEVLFVIGAYLIFVNLAPVIPGLANLACGAFGVPNCTILLR